MVKAFSIYHARWWGNQTEREAFSSGWTGKAEYQMMSVILNINRSFYITANYVVKWKEIVFFKFE